MQALRTCVAFAAWVFCVQAAAQDSATRELRELEDRLSRALVELDAETIDQLFHPDLVFIGTTGAVFSKAERLAGLRQTAPQQPEGNVNDEFVIHVEGQTAIVVVSSTWTYAAGARRFRALHVWIRDDEQWRLRAAQVAMLRE